MRDDGDRGRRLDAIRRCQHVGDFLQRNPDLLANIADPLVPGVKGRRLLSLVNEDKLRRILARMLDEERFLGPHGIRSVSRWHLDHPYVSTWPESSTGAYEPAESTTGMFGGNSNWRGPVWFPMNLLLIRALLQHYRYYGDDLNVECPTGSGTMMTLFEVAQELSCRLVGTFLRDGTGGVPSTAGPSSSRTTRIGATSSCSTSTSTATTAPGSVPPTRPAGPASWPG